MSDRLHADFPEVPEKGTDTWSLPAPLDDIEYALIESGGRVDLWDIAEVTDYAISYHGAGWVPDQTSSSELELTLIARLKDGRAGAWIGLEAGNDYTGWGCMGDHADLYVGDSRDDVISNGITNDGRSALGLGLR